MVTPDEHHARLSQAFSEVLHLQGAEREAFLQRFASTDPALAVQLQQLLEADANTSPWLDEGSAVGPSAVAAAIPGAGQRMGPFTLGPVIGRGGHGVVYAAVQDSPRREVALKILESPLGAHPELAARFEAEARFLAHLDHPGICRVYAAGHDDERPWMAMERLRGQDFISAARELPLTERLELFQQVCSAVAFAHGRGVLHRDLKPDNLIVTEAGEVKVLDFGLARLLPDAAGPAAPSAAWATDDGRILGTLPYMAPEQAEGDPHAIDIRTDVFALGLILGEALTGHPVRDLREASVSHAIQKVSSEPIRLDQQVSATLPSDLVTIFQTATHLDRTQRYATVDAFADDLERLRRHETIRARPPSALYVLSRFARRHRLSFAAASLALLGLSTGLVLALRAADEADRQRASAEAAGLQETAARKAAVRAAQEARDAQAQATQQAAIADETLKFVETAFAELDPYNATGQQASLLDGLDAIEERLERDPPQDRAVRGRLMLLLGSQLSLQRDDERALRWFERSRAEIDLELQKEALFLTHHKAFYSLLRLQRKEEAAESLAACDPLLPHIKPALQAQHHSAAAVLAGQRGELKAALASSTRAIEIILSHPEARPTAIVYASFHNRHAFLLQRQGAVEDSLDVLERGDAALIERFGDKPHPLRVTIATTRGQSLWELGKREAAKLAVREAITMREVLGEAEAPQAAGSHLTLAHMCEASGELAAAQQQYTRAQELIHKGYGEGHPLAIEIQAVLIRLANRQNQHERTIALCEALLANGSTRAPAHHDERMVALNIRAHALESVGSKEALKAREQALRAFDAMSLPRGSDLHLDALVPYADRLMRADRSAEAAPLYEEALGHLERSADPEALRQRATIHRGAAAAHFFCKKLAPAGEHLKRAADLLEHATPTMRTKLKGLASAWLEALEDPTPEQLRLEQRIRDSAAPKDDSP